MINNRPFINLVMQVGNFKNHSQMADELKISRVSISRIYHNAQNVSAETILAVHEYLGIPVYEIREVLQSRSIEETKMPKVNAEVREDYLSLMNAGVTHMLCNQVDEVIDYLVESGKVVRAEEKKEYPSMFQNRNRDEY